MVIKKTNLFCFSNNEKYYAVFDQSIKVFKIDSGELLFKIKIDDRGYSLIDFSQDDKYIVAYKNANKQLLIIDIFSQTTRCVQLNLIAENLPYIFTVKDVAYLVYGVNEIVKCSVYCVSLKQGEILKRVVFSPKYYIRAVDFSYINSQFHFIGECVSKWIRNVKVYENEYLNEDKYTRTVSIKLDTDLNKVFKAQKQGNCSITSSFYLSKYDSFISNSYGFLVCMKNFCVKSVIDDDYYVEDKSKSESFLLCIKNNTIWKIIDTNSFAEVDITRINEDILYGKISSNGRYVFLNGKTKGYILKSPFNCI